MTKEAEFHHDFHFRSYLYRLAILPHAEEMEPSAMFHPPIIIQPSFGSKKSLKRDKKRAMLKLRKKEIATPTFTQMSQFDQDPGRV